VQYQQDGLSTNALVTLAAQMSRDMLARALGQYAYEGNRDYYTVLGYERNPDYDYYMQRYERGDIASRVVDLPAQDTWKRPPMISENDETDTPFCDAWEELSNRLRVWSALTRADRLRGIGSYGVLLIGTKDSTDLKTPLGAGVLKSPQDVLYLRPLDEKGATISSWVHDPASPRYGMPELYSIDVSMGDLSGQKLVHWTRVLHLADGKLNSDTYGTPRLLKVLNRLDDLVKLVGGSAEATWLGMRPGTMFGPKEGYDMDTTTKRSELEEEIYRYAHDPLRVLLMRGIEAQQLGAPSVIDISGPFDVAMSLISAASGIPKRILMGSAAGELASAQEDSRQWAGTIRARQKTYAEPEILRPLIDRLIMIGALPKPPQGYDIGELDPKTDDREWPSILENTEIEDAQIVQARAQAVRTLSDTVTGQMPITHDEARELLGYPPEETSQITPDNPLIRPTLPPFTNALRVNRWNVPVNVPTLGIEAANEELLQFSASMQLLAEQAAKGEIDRDRYEQELAALIMAISVSLYLAASEKSYRELDTADFLVIRDYQQVALDSIDNLSEDLYERRFFDPETGDIRLPALGQRLSLWVLGALGLANIAQALGHPEERYEWVLGATVQHCDDCARLNGQVHTGDEWKRSGFMPQGRNLKCGGWHCDCKLMRTNRPTQGGF
jgi:hypothetical protein